MNLKDNSVKPKYYRHGVDSKPLHGIAAETTINHDLGRKRGEEFLMDATEQNKDMAREVVASFKDGQDPITVTVLVDKK